MKQTVYVVCPWFDTFAGGAERALRQLAESLADYGFPVHVLTTCSQSPYKDWIKHQNQEGTYKRDGLTVTRFAVDENLSPYHAANAKLISEDELTDKEKTDFFTYSITSHRLIEHLRQTLEPHDRILCGPYFQALSHNLVSALPKRVHLLPAFHDEKPFYWEPVQTLLQNVAGVFFLSHAEKELVIRAHGKSLNLAYQDWPVTGLPIDKPVTVETSSEPPYLAYIGRFDRGKNVPKLCEWHMQYWENAANGDYPPMQLKFVGSGDLSTISDHPAIDVVGYLDEAEKTQLMQDATAIINLSPNESFSYVIMEAGALEVPVIVSADCAVTTDHVTLSEGGWALNTAREYQELLSNLTDDPNTGRTAGQKGKAFISYYYNRDRVESYFINELFQ